MKKRVSEGRIKKRQAEVVSDSGFSLVELLIAVTVLAVLVVPMLHMFVTSARINAKSRQTLRAGSVAQDIMEGLKAYTLEEVRTQFAPPEGTDASMYYNPKEGFYIIDSSLIRGGVREIGELEKDGEEIYYFGIEKIRIQEGEYDVRIKVDASTYGRKAKDKSRDPNAVHDSQFNGKFYAEIGSVSEISGGVGEADRARDSSYHQSKDLDEDVLKDLKKKIGNDILSSGKPLPADWDELTFEDIVSGQKNFSGLTRNMEIVIEAAENKDAAGNEQCKATVNFIYECKYNGVTYKSSGLAGTAGGEVRDITRTFSSGNFYLFYYPVYSTDRAVDSIEFRIKDESRLFDEERPLLKSIVVAKQIRATVDASENIIVPELPRTGPGSLQEKESAYKMNMMMIEPSSPNLTFRTNLDTNLADGEEATLFNIVYDIGDADICTFTGDDASENVTNVIYDIEISVYEAGAAKYFAQSNFEENDEVHKLATVTNLN